jgi:hypothetical protein
LKAKKFKTKDLELAVRQALNPSLLTQLEEDDEEEEEEEEEETKKGKGKKPVAKKTPVTNGKTKKPKQTTSATAKRRSRKLTLGEEDAVDETAVGDSDRKKRVSLLSSFIQILIFFFSVNQCRSKRMMSLFMDKVIIIKKRSRNHQNIRKCIILDTDYNDWYTTRKR